jgi:hypothetical protein
MDDQALAAYIDKFYGYGNYRGAWWLVGMEEGSTGTSEEIVSRLDLWSSRGCRELEDVAMFASSAPPLSKWFTPRPPLQPTWRGLVRLILSAERRSTDAEAARLYQGNELGRADSNNCLLELLPLPSPSVDRWIYAEHSGLPELRSRPEYLERIAPKRVRHLQRRIQEHRPRAVIFYSRRYQPWWEQITGASFGAPVEPGVQLVKTRDTLFVMTPHPTYRGLTSDYFAAVGRTIAAATG